MLARIGRHGPLDFAEFMQAALYDPESGYYADPDRAIGRRGDYFTSVSVGPAFGAILARWAHRRWEVLGRPERWRIAEAGAHDGTLALDLAAALARVDPAAAAALVYTIPEPLAARRGLLADRLARLPGRAAAELIDPVADPPPEPLPGVVIANEVIDALPCHLVEFDGRRWTERVVAADGGRLALRSRPIDDPRLAKIVEPLGSAFPAGYRTEIRTNLGPFLAPLRDLLARGALLFIDYGFARPELYDPGRRDGTLQTYHRHRSGDDPLADPGERDLTAHVDFTAVAEAAADLGMALARFDPQGSFLTDVGRHWLDGLAELPTDDRAAAVRQFQTLTHPAHLGARFHALELAWRITPDPDSAGRARRRLALD